MKAEEYLEGILEDAFERELEVSENVARTLPFFTASLAVVVPLYGYVSGRLPQFSFSFLSIVLYGLLTIGSACGIMILWNLFLMVRVREYRIPPRETAQIEWMKALRAYFEAQGLTPATVDKKVTQALRDRMLAEYAASAEHNRKADAPKLRARASGVFFFVIMLAIAFAMIAIIFTSQRLSGPPTKDTCDAAVQGAPKDGCLAPASAAAKAAGAPTGVEVSRCAGGEHCIGSGSQVSEVGKTAASAPATPATPAAPASTPPAPPVHQLLKKNEDSGGPLIRRR